MTAPAILHQLRDGLFKFGSIASVLAMALLLFSPARSLGQCTVSNILVNSCGPWVGARAMGNPNVPAEWKDQLLYHEQRIGAQETIVHAYDAANSSNTPIVLDSDDLYFIYRANTYLLLNWKPVRKWVDAGGGNATVNANIDAMADSIKAVAPRKVFLSIWHEAANDISGGTTCTQLKGSAGTPEEYVNMWHNVRARFDAKGVTNVVWVMIYISDPDWDCTIKDLWPGDAYVDWVAWDQYPSGDVTWYSRTSRFYDLLLSDEDSTHHFAEKPWMLGEYGMWYKTQPPVYQAYLDEQAAIDHNTFPNLKAYVIFDSAKSQIDYTASGQQDDIEQGYYSDLAKDLIARTSSPVVAGNVQLITQATLSKQADGSYLDTVTVKNNGSGTAVDVAVTAASLGTTTDASPMPQSLRNIAPGDTSTLTIFFPSTSGTSGTRVIEKVSGTYSGGTFGGSFRAVLP